MSDIRRAVLYAAKSTEDRHGSIPTQLADGRAIAAQEGWIVAAEYSDEAFSAYSGDRGPGLAAALRDCERIASEDGSAALIVQHSDRLSRGDGKTSKHTVEYALWGLKADVVIRSVQDPQTFEDLLYAVVTGQRNNEDSRRKSQATRDGLRRAAERGEWAGGIRPDGYTVLREVDEHGRITRQLVKDAERREIFETIWALALAAKSAEAITLELSTRGWKTAPIRRDAEPRPFDANRVRQTLATPAYAGLVAYKGEILPVTASWEPYVQPEDWYRLRAERLTRAPNATKRPAGRPLVGYVLSGLAVCGECGAPAHGNTRWREAGSPRRRYVCAHHREQHPDSPEWCAAVPYDAAAVDRLVLAGLDSLLADADSLREQLLAGQRAERARLQAEIQRAQDDLVKTERGRVLADRHYEAAVRDGKESAARAVLRGMAALDRAHADAQALQNAALDALAAAMAEPEPDAGQLMQALYESLSRSMTAAKATPESGSATAEDLKRQQEALRVRKLNEALRGHFDSFTISRDESGALSVTPRLSAAAIERILRNPAAWPHGVRATVDGVACEVEGDGENLRLARDYKPGDKIPTEGEDVEIALRIGHPPALTHDGGNPPSPW